MQHDLGSNYWNIVNGFDWSKYLSGLSTIPGTDSEVRICCPNCGEKDYKCYVNASKGVFNCFKCDFHTGEYTIVDFVSLIEGTDHTSTFIRLLQECTPVLPDDIEYIINNEMLMEQKIVRSLGIKYLDSLPSSAHRIDGSSIMEGKFKDYLLNRGLTSDDIHIMQTHYVLTDPVEKQLNSRVVWPVFGGERRLVSYIARTILPNHKPKYFNARKSDLNKTVWPYVTPNSDVVLVEGILDALAIRRAGYSAYATFGKSLSIEQVSLFKQVWKVDKLCLFWDKRDASKEMTKCIDKNKHIFDITVPDFSKWSQDDKDAGDALREETVMEDVKNALDHRISVDSEDYILWGF